MNGIIFLLKVRKGEISSKINIPLPKEPATKSFSLLWILISLIGIVGIPPFNSTGIIDFYRYLRDIERNGRLPDFEKFQREHSQESMVSAWTCILSDELKQKQS